MPTSRAFRAGWFCALAFATAASPAPGAVAPLTLSATEVNILEIPAAASAEAGFRVVIYSGSAEDPEGREGLAWMTASAVARQAGAGVGFEVGKEVTVFTASAPPGTAPLRFNDMARALVRLAPDAAALEALRAGQKEALERLRADPVRLCREGLDRILYQRHAYGHPPEGTDSSVERITREEILSFHADHFRKGNLAVGLHGAVAPGLAGAVRQGLADLPEGAPSRVVRPISFLARPRILLVHVDGSPSSRIAAGHPLNLTRAHPDYASLTLGLGLDREPREGPLPRRRESLLLLEEIPPAGAADAVERLILEFARLKAHPVEEARLAEVKRAIAGWRAGALGEASRALASRMDDYLYRSPGSDERFGASLDAVTAESARSALERHIFPERVAVAVLTPDAAALSRELLRRSTHPAIAAIGAGTIRKEEIEVVRSEALFR